MYKVDVWVPTKGWKLVRCFRSLNAAVDCAEEMEPLEVRVSCPSGEKYYGGKFCVVDYDIPMATRTLPTFDKV